MEYRRLGRSGTKVSTLCLGTMTFGPAPEGSMMHGADCDEKTSFQIMARALDAGINFFDCADVYGPDGLSERVLGKWFESAARRDEVVLATKCRFRTADGPLGTGASRRRIMRTCDDSLRRLKTDRIDLYQIHMQDIDTPEEETLRALDDLVRAGKVLYIGASNYAAYRLSDALWTSEVKNLERFVTLQTQYSLAVREIEREHVPLCRSHEVGLLPWSPLAGGFLSGKFRRNETLPEGTRLGASADRLVRFDNERGWAVIDVLCEVADGIGATPAQVALAWLLARPGVVSAIFGARSLDQLDDNLQAAEITLPDDAMARLTEASEPELIYPYNMFTRVQGAW
jgi:aryl-alcohol dehydrogenase-like predicted oxidoreductase